MTPPSSRPVVQVAVPVPLPGLFDYLPPPGGVLPTTGQRVLVPFGRRQLVGVVAGHAPESAIDISRLQAVIEVLDEEPVMPTELLRLLGWCSAYYKHPHGEVVANALPPALRTRQGRLPAPPRWWTLTDTGRARLDEGPGRAPAQHAVLQALAAASMDWDTLRGHQPAATARVRAILLEQGWIVDTAPCTVANAGQQGPELTDEQRRAVDAIGASEGFQCHLLDGVTGSGKTEVYLRLIADTLRDGRQALVLVPEIGLTPQLLSRFRERLGIEPLLSHSGLSRGERLAAWATALRDAPPLIIGTRSALFLPLSRPGLLVMDESHDTSFKQQDGFRFSARDVAIKRALDCDVPIVLGTATPALETLCNAQRGRYAWHRLRQRATGASQPRWRVLDLRQQAVDGGLSGPARKCIGETLDRREQVLVFLNRRGYAPVLLCHDCGWHAGCRDCDANLTWHQGSRRLVCHHCGASEAVPRFCPECRADALQGAGAGTEQLESFLGEAFPGQRLMRVDRDSVRRKGELEALVAEVKRGEPCILVGTQMLAKGHHFPRVTLVVIVDLDQALYSADYRAIERMGQVLMQVAGRAGRAEHAGEVLLQTHHPDHPALQTLLSSGYEAFAAELLEERRVAGLPPHTFQAALRADAPDAGAVRAFLEQARRCWPGQGGEVYGPFPAMMERRAGRVRWYVLAQGSVRAELQRGLDRWVSNLRALKPARTIRWALDVDPQEF